MKRPTMLVEAILRQAEMDLDLSVERDIVVIRRRCEHEGFSFLTITLPTLSDALERGLECGHFTCPTSFRRHGALPHFLGGLLKCVFSSSGELLDDACPEAVKFLRQICRFFKKPKMECLPEVNRDAIQHFIDVEGELRGMTSHVERKDILLDKISGIIWSQVFPEIDGLDLICHHGPGFTADRLLPNGRNRIRKWNQRSELLYPSDLHAFPNYGLAAAFGLDTGRGQSDDLGLKHLDLKDEESVRVVFVPKTQTAPRVIAIEPSHVQYIQQSLKDHVYKVLEEHRLTKHSIRFTRQDVNQKLAHRGSIDKRTATLDLKDASDRVHLHLVQRIFKTSGLLEYLEDARSLHATLPDGRNVILSKYASMGSALCFPVEAMVFYTLVQVAMHYQDGRHPSSSSIERYSAMIDIYGDDIIVPVDYADAVVSYLESFALKVNINKSFKEGNFRESCGGDYFKGVAVNPVYARQVPHDDSRSWGPETVMSWVATANLFYMKGMWHVAQVIRDMVSRVVRRSIPVSHVLGPGVVFYSFFQSTSLRYNGDLHCWEQKRLQYYPLKRKDNIDGDELACLNKWANHTTSRQSGCSYDASRRNSSFSAERSEYIHGRDSSLRDTSQTYCECRLGRESPSGDADVISCSFCGLPYSLPYERIREYSFRGVESGLQLCSEDVTRAKPGFSADYCLTEEVQSDPLRYLEGNAEGLDFRSSTKRGSFKSKCRWVSLAG